MNAPEQSQDPVVREIIELERQRCAAYIDRDVAMLDRLLPEDFTFTRPGGLVFTKGPLLTAIAQGELIFKRIDRRYDNVSVFENTASATGRDTLQGSYQGQDFSGQYHYRATYVQRDSGWELAVTHSSHLTGALPAISEVIQQKGSVR